MPQKLVEFTLDDLELVENDPDFLRVTSQAIVEKVKELKTSGELEGTLTIGISVVW